MEFLFFTPTADGFSGETEHLFAPLDSPTSLKKGFLPYKVYAKDRVHLNCQLRVLRRIRAEGAYHHFGPRHIAATCGAHYVKHQIYTILVKCGLLYDLGKRTGRLLQAASFFFLFYVRSSA